AASQRRVVDQVRPVEVQLDVGDRDRLELRQVDDVAVELAVQHHHHRPGLAGHAADEPVAHERQAVVAGGQPAHTVTEPERHPAVTSATSATTASESSGHARSASARHESNERSVSATRAHAAAGSTHIIVPAPPKWPYVDALFVAPVQCGDLVPLISS